MSSTFDSNEPLPKHIYKILPSPPPTPLPTEFPLSELDRSSGFIHLSRARQLALPLSRFFADVEEITLLKIPFERVREDVRWDEIASADRYPHLLRGLMGSDVASWKTLRREGGKWEDVLAADREWLE